MGNVRALACLMSLAACAAEPAGDLDTAELDQAATVCGDGPTVKGIDVSYYQSNIDWAAVAADDVEFAFVRVSDGVNTVDSKFAQNWAGAKANGVLRGAYQYFRPNQDPIAQANLLLDKMGPLEPGDLPPVIDIETMGGMSSAVVVARARQWIDHVKAATGVQPIVYTAFYFWRDQVGGADFSESPLWHAQYTSAACPNIAAPWTDWAFWQYTDSGRVAGITTGGVDTNRFNGTREQLELLGMAAAPCEAIPATGGVIDDGDACFTSGGPQASLRRIADAGEGSDLLWTYTTAEDAESNYGRWHLNLAAAGRYRIEVSTASAYAKSTQARYAIRAAGAMHEVAIDQTAADGWQSLGEFDLAAGPDQWVHLADNTGEPLADRVQLAFDAVRLTHVGEPRTDVDPPVLDEPGTDDSAGGCSTGGTSGGAASLAMVLASLLRRRRRR